MAKDQILGKNKALHLHTVLESHFSYIYDTFTVQGEMIKHGLCFSILVSFAMIYYNITEDYQFRIRLLLIVYEKTGFVSV